MAAMKKMGTHTCILEENKIWKIGYKMGLLIKLNVSYGGKLLEHETDNRL
jgi:hypothetical protein